VLKKGSQLTVLSYSKTVNDCRNVVEDLESRGLDVELIDLRTISPPDIDYETIGRSLKKTHILVIVEQASRNLALGAKIAAHCQRTFFDELDAPIVTLSGRDIPNPVSKRLEQAAVPSPDDIRQTIIDAAAKRF